MALNFLKKLWSSSTSQKENTDKALYKTNASFFSKLTDFFTGKKSLDSNTLELIEEALYEADVHSDTVFKLLSKIEKRKTQHMHIQDVIDDLKNEIKIILHQSQQDKDANTPAADEPYTILIVGVNGVGKTTSIAKLAKMFQHQGKKVLIGAADTFRAAAIEQLTLWAKKIDVPIVAKYQGADPASVVYDTMQSGLAKKQDVIIIDTAGRLHNKTNLMEELSKMKRVIQKQVPSAPHEVWLVIDGTTGQNAIQQAQEFSKYTNVTGLIVTKLDGSAKGGCIISIADQLKLPICFIGTGEGEHDLTPFDADIFLHSFFNFKTLEPTQS